jgi:hypothetical protein
MKNEVQQHAETLALQAALIFILRRIIKTNPLLLDAVSSGFLDAVKYVENFAIKAGNAAASQKGIREVKELWAATLGHDDKPRHG